MSLQSHVKVQEDLHARLSRASINFKKSPKDRITTPYIETRLENIEELWAQFSVTHNQIVKEFEPKVVTSSPYTVNEVYFYTEELYLDLKCEFKTALCKIKKSDVLPVAGSNKISEGKGVNIKLPRITIPTFSGKYTEWPTFRDLFVSAIHKNSNIENVQKLHYLKGYLTGEAEQLLRHIPISESNYDRCWAQLETRYNNKKYLSHCILKRLLSQRNIVQESASALKELIDTTSDCLNALSNLDIDITSWDILIIHIISLKLDPDSKRDWELKVTSNTDSDKLPTFEQFKDFLTGRYRAFEFLVTNPIKNNVNVNKAKVFHTAANTGPIVCPFCNNEHKMKNCKLFIGEDVDTRRKFVQDHNLCFNCLGHNHSARFCKCTASCQVCKRRHHSLLHPKREQDSVGEKGASSSDIGLQTKENTDTVGVETSKEVVTCFSKGTANNQVLLATALVRAVSKNGVSYTIRALLDQGSQASFVTEHTVQSLGLQKKPTNGLITGININSKLSINSVVEVKIQSRVNPSFELVVKAYVLKSITSLLPVRETVYQDWAQVNDIQLADPRYHQPDKVDMLLGAEVYSQVLKNGLKKASVNSMGSTVAQCTSLGWILSGTVASAAQNTSNIAVMHAQLGDDEILKKFWELEKEPNQNKKHILTKEESSCEEIFKNTTVRDNDGRYVVNLPFRSEDPSCKYGDSRKIAVNRLYALEAKLSKNPDLKIKYGEVINEYLQLGHMRQITKEEEQNQHAVYLPHHAVIRDDKDTTKVRVVFDASCKGKNGISLNDDLMIGPGLQPDLRHLLIRWRTYRICLISDIIKMYRMVRVADSHTDFQRIVWRDNKQSPIKDYKLLTVTFGTSAAPFLAVRSMQQVAYDEGANYPLAAERVLKDYYMDDLMTGCDSIEEGMQIYSEMNKLLAKAGFNLQKWSSNSNELLASIIGEKHSYKGQDGVEREINIKQDEIFKTLGLTWNRSCDTFQYTVQLPLLQESVTKRKLLSDIARLFDPLGWVAPVIVLAKMLIQKLWISGIGWDEEIPYEIKTEWLTYRRELQSLTEFSVPRWLHMRHGDKQVDLHGFCDASKLAYASVVYARVVDADGRIHVTLITAKTKVAPIKTVSVPRLELCGAVLLAKLLSEVSEVIGIGKSNLYYWTDSEIVLAWLNSHPNKWKKFVANRVSEILCLSEPQQWNFIQPKINFAGCASRRLYAPVFVRFKAVILDMQGERPKRKRFKSLHLYLGSVNILRVGGRQECSDPNMDREGPCRWFLGRAIERRPGTDSLTRVVTLSSNGSIFKRPTSKLCVLPIA